MIKQAITLSLVAIVALGAAEKPSKEWDDRYAALSKLLRAKNLKGFQASFAPTFTSVGPDKSVQTREEFFKSFESAFKSGNKLTPLIKLKDATKSGDKVMVSFDFHLEVKGAKRTMKIHEVGTDTWQMIDGKWKMVKTVDTALTVK